MYTSSEISALRAADPGVVIPGIDTQTGNQTASLTPVTSLTTNASAPVYYDAALNQVVVNQAGTVLSGYNFGSAMLSVQANNVTVENSTFTNTAGYYSVQADDVSGTVVTKDTFTTSESIISDLTDYVQSHGGTISITDNSFLNSPGDSVTLSAGTVSGNYFSSGTGANSGGQHPDAIWIDGTTGPTDITDNFIDWTSPTNATMRITTEMGSNTSDVTASGNFLFGGVYNIDAGTIDSGQAKATFSNINIDKNYMGYGVVGAFYPGATQGTTESGNVILGNELNPTSSSSTPGGGSTYASSGSGGTTSSSGATGDPPTTSSSGATGDPPTTSSSGATGDPPTTSSSGATGDPPTSPSSGSTGTTNSWWTADKGASNSSASAWWTDHNATSTSASHWTGPAASRSSASPSTGDSASTPSASSWASDSASASSASSWRADAASTSPSPPLTADPPALFAHWMAGPAASTSSNSPSTADTAASTTSVASLLTASKALETSSSGAYGPLNALSWNLPANGAQAQGLAAVLSHTANNGFGTALSDSQGDKLALPNLAAAATTGSAAHF